MGEVATRKLHSLTPDAMAADRRLGLYLAERFSESLVLLGDLQPGLRQHVSRGAVALGSAGIEGAALRFTAFARPVVAVVADDVETTMDLVRFLTDGDPVFVVVAHDKAMVEQLRGADLDDDLWMTRDLIPAPTAEAIRENPADDEATAFYAACGMTFFHRDMLRLGPWSSQRDRGELIAAAGLSFNIPSMGYAHIANVATLPALRGRGHGSRMVEQQCRQLAAAGFRRCGLFCDGSDADLIRFYERLGFHPEGRFLTLAVESLTLR